MNTAKLLLYDYPGSICCQMARLTLVEKGLAFDRHTVDIVYKAQQFEPWYTALNPRAVVPTLSIDGEIIIDTIDIVHRIDAQFDGPSLTPTDPQAAAAMNQMMADIMALHYGVLLYSGTVDAEGRSETIVARGKFLRAQLEKYPDRAEILEKRIAGNTRMQAIMADPAQVKRHVDDARDVVGQIDAALAKTEYVSADTYTLADTFATAALARFHMHGFQGWWADGDNANVADYYRRMRERPSWEAAGVVESMRHLDP